MSVGIASAAFKEQNFDNNLTVETAIELGLSAVQIFIDPTKPNQDIPLIEDLIGQLKNYQGIIVIHMRNPDQVTDKDIAIVEQIERSLGGQKIKILTHYFDGMTIDQVPVINGQKVGIENSKTGVHDMEHVQRAYDLSREVNSFFVFDHGRVMYPEPTPEMEQNIDAGQIQEREFRQRNPNTQSQHIAVNRFILENLEPGRDLIHSADKLTLDQKFSKSWTFNGDPSGVGFNLLTTLTAYHLLGGTIIFEHENFELALRSASVIES